MINLSHIELCTSVMKKVILAHKHLPFSTDTRKYKHPSAFVAIPGAKVNPLDVIQALLIQGCPLVVYQHDEINDQKAATLKKAYPHTEFLPVVESVLFLQQISHYHILEWQKKSPRNTVFAISGSNGKTTHKEMLSHMLREVLPGRVVATEKNNNNHLGVPLTLLDVTEQTQFLVLELGSNHPGEIKVLCDIAVPNAGMTTNIGATHLEFFGSEKEVFEEEAYLYHALKQHTAGRGFFLINTDDTFLATLEKTAGSIFYGTTSNSEARVSFLNDGAEITFNNNKLTALNHEITGKHNKLNLITCLFIAHHFYPEHKEALVNAAKNFRPTKNRSQWIDFEGKPVFLDAYNANPSSMKAALEGFKESVLSRGHQLSTACVVLGDMNELGDATPEYHAQVGSFVKSLGFTQVYFVGRFSAHYLKGFPEGNARASSKEFKNEYRSDCLKQYAIHFIKGSRSLQLESLFDIT